MNAGEVLYALFMALALLVALLARRALPPDPPYVALPARARRTLALAAFVGGVLGARLPFLLAHEEAFVHDGKTILSGLAGGYLAVEIAKVALGIRTKTGDTFALPLALACAVGRFGCFFHGCCAGVRTGLPWACDFGDGVPRHPTQLYEALFHLAMAWALYAMLRKDALRLQRLKLYLIAYCGFRFAIEFLRTEPRVALGLTPYQWAAPVFALLLALQWRLDRRAIVAPLGGGGLREGHGQGAPGRGHPCTHADNVRPALRAISRSNPPKTSRCKGHTTHP